MAFQNHTGGRRLINAARYSWAGLKAAWRNEEAFRQESALCAVLVPAALWWGDGAVERALLVGSLLLILIVELLNSSIEAAIDRIGPERHELAGRAKDIGSAAVFVTLLNAAFLWLILLLT
ncbi:MAG: diacylglycerol kinase [Candidatus Competibacter sp.]|nr:diacylglycerol kinase [Candidatus Competibacter sp.]